VSDACLAHVDWRFTETPYKSIFETAAVPGRNVSIDRDLSRVMTQFEHSDDADGLNGIER
jgi:hypothetical protein